MRILITGGPTWIKIDRVRILTNIFTGMSSLYFAKYFARRKCDVTLLANTHCINALPKNIEIVAFRYFNELKHGLGEKLKSNKYNAVIHAAAVSDYIVKHSFKGKIPSGKDRLKMEFIPAPKLTGLIRRHSKGAYLIQFKLEISNRNLINRAYKSLIKNGFDAVVANSLDDLTGSYKSFVIDRSKNIIEVHSKKELAGIIFDNIKSYYQDKAKL